jgi:uncharacterized protein
VENQVPWEPRDGGLALRVRVTPRGRRDAIEGMETLADGRAVLKVRVRAAPEDGAANEAVRRLVAKAAGRPASAVTLSAGATARMKTLLVAGDPAALAAALAGHLAAEA